METNNKRAHEYAIKAHKGESMRNAAEAAFAAGQEWQLEDDIKCTALYVRRFCIQYKIPDVDAVVERFEREMRQ